jgi:hypothetical protein
MMWTASPRGSSLSRSMLVPAARGYFPPVNLWFQSLRLAPDT